ncbi:HDOD domain-containing protein [Marinobacter sp. 1Y8]
MTRAPMALPANSDLPSLPQVVLRAMEACRNDCDYREIGRIISADTALCGRVLALANSALYGRPGEVTAIEHALLRLGTHRLQTLIITASLQHLLLDLGTERWQQIRDFWRHSLTTALTARALAKLTGYPDTEEAFMVGMLHNAGELIALRATDSDDYQAILDQQIDIAARLAGHWGLGQMATDAIRYQQAPARDIRDAAHLVKLINLSTRLALSDSGGFDAAQTIFGLTGALAKEISARIDREVASIANDFGIPLDGSFDAITAQRHLFHEVIRSAIIEQAVGSLPDMATETELLGGALGNLSAVTGRPGLAFLRRDNELSLLAATRVSPPAITVPLDAPASLITYVATDGNAQVLQDDSVSILDRQLLGLLNTPSMMCVPVCHQGHCFGLYVIGLESAGEFADFESLASLFAQRVAALGSQLDPYQQSHSQQGETIEQLAQRIELRKRVHEVSNPLTIVRQYIHQLQKKLKTLEGSDVVDADFQVVREELDRAAGLLERISSAGLPEDDSIHEDSGGSLSLNDELNLLSDLFEEALFAPNEITGELRLTSAPTAIKATRGPVRQLVMNLVRNAVESMPGGGRVQFQTAAPVWQDGCQWVELMIEDTGNGIPESIRNALFKPVHSTKGPGHSGLGLSIVKQLTDDMEGIISCRTGAEGTSFRILLPATTHTRSDNREEPGATI